MTHTIQMAEQFGPFLADGLRANQFRSLHVDSVWERYDRIVFDFQGVFNLTDSFAFACFGNLAEAHAADFRTKVKFRNCTETVRSFVGAAVAEGLRLGLEHAS